MFSRAVKAACRAPVPATRGVRLVSGTRLTHSSAPRPSAAAAAVASSSSWAAATESAHSVLVPPTSSSSKQQRHGDVEDPLAAITAEIGELKYSLFHMLGSSHPSLDAVAKYYFNAEGKHLRPLIVLLMSQATNGIAGAGWEQAELQARQGVRTRSGGVDDALTNVGGILNDWNPESMGEERGGEMVFAKPFRIQTASKPPPPTTPSPFADLLPTGGPGSPTILPTQRRLANITEMIHVASLLHDDVIDASDLRRGSPSAPSAFGNKLSILGGDFLLGRASVSLARLGSTEVVELMASVINNLVEGEIIQLRATTSPATAPTEAGFEVYMRKTYLKTASLMAKSARSAVVLGGCGSNPGKDTTWVKDVAYGYGRNLGIAFQLVDDMLDFLPATHDLGKPGSGADMRLGLATAPALFAWEEFPELGPLIARKFEGPGDTEVALDLVGKSRGMERTAELARKFAGEARALVELLPESPARDALVGLTVKVVDRVK